MIWYDMMFNTPWFVIATLRSRNSILHQIVAPVHSKKNDPNITVRVKQNPRFSTGIKPYCTHIKTAATTSYNSSQSELFLFVDTPLIHRPNAYSNVTFDEIVQVTSFLKGKVGMRHSVNFYPNVTTLRSCICYRKSVCLSVCHQSATFVHATQPVKIFCNISTPFRTVA